MRRVFMSLAVVAAMPLAQATILQVPSAGFPTIASAVAAATTGDTIKILPGTYQEPLLLAGKNGVTVVGKGKVVIDAAGLMNGIVLSNEDSVVIDNLTVRNAVARGVELTGVSKSTLRKLKVEDSGDDGIKTSSCDSLQITQCIATGSGGDGFDLFMDGGLVSKCVTKSSVENGLRLNGVGNAVRDSTFDVSTQNGVIIGSDVVSNANSLANLKIRHTLGSGVSFAAFADGNLLRNSTVLDAGFGVSIGGGSDDNSITKLVVSNCGGSGFLIAGDHNVVTSCAVKKADNDGFSILAAGEENLLLDDLAAQAGDNGFELAGDGNSLIHNQAKQCNVPASEVGNPTNFYVENTFAEP